MGWLILKPAPVSALVLSGTFPAAYLNIPYTASLAISGGVAPYTYTLVSGALPTGDSLAVVGSNLVQSGTPSLGGNFTFAVKVTDSVGVESNTVTITNMVVNVFASPTFSAMMGRRNQARTGAIRGGYLGDITTYGTDVTIVSGNSTGHWQTQNRTTSVPSGSGTGIGLVQQEGGLAPRGNGSGGNNWLTSAWPGTSGGTLQNSYSVVVQHTATGQQCTINVNCDAATTKTWNNRTYNLGNAYVISSEWECRNFGSIGPNNYITRNATEGGWLILRDDTFLGSPDPTYPNFWLGQGSYASGSVAFDRGTFSKNNIVEGNTIFQSTHGDNVSRRIIEGQQGGNWTLVSPETFKGAKVTNMQAAISGLAFVGVDFDTSGITGGVRFGLQFRSQDCIVDCCEINLESGGTSGNKFGLRVLSGSPNFITIINSYFTGVDNACQMNLIDMVVAGNVFDGLASDCVNGSCDPASGFPAGGTFNSWMAFNTLINVNAAAGAHPDFFQFYFTGSGGLTPPGTIVVEKNMALATCQMVYSAGALPTTNLMTISDRNNMSVSGKHAYNHTSAYAGQFTSTCNTILQDFDGPDYDPANRPGNVVGNGNVNVTIKDNASVRIDSGSVSGTLIITPTTNTVSGDNALLTPSNAAFANYWKKALTAGAGGLPALTAGIHDWESAWVAGFDLFVPKKALAGAGGLWRADGTFPGAMLFGSAPYAPLWNDGVTVVS